MYAQYSIHLMSSPIILRWECFGHAQSCSLPASRSTIKKTRETVSGRKPVKRNVKMYKKILKIDLQTTNRPIAFGSQTTSNMYIE